MNGIKTNLEKQAVVKDLKEHGVVTQLRISAQIRSENRKFSVFVEITYAKPIFKKIVKIPISLPGPCKEKGAQFY
jgi:hypothetical protein